MDLERRCQLALVERFRDALKEGQVELSEPRAAAEAGPGVLVRYANWDGIGVTIQYSDKNGPKHQPWSSRIVTKFEKDFRHELFSREPCGGQSFFFDEELEHGSFEVLFFRELDQLVRKAPVPQLVR